MSFLLLLTLRMPLTIMMLLLLFTLPRLVSRTNGKPNLNWHLDYPNDFFYSFQNEYILLNRRVFQDTMMAMVKKKKKGRKKEGKNERKRKIWLESYKLRIY